MNVCALSLVPSTPSTVRSRYSERFARIHYRLEIADSIFRMITVQYFYTMCRKYEQKKCFFLLIFLISRFWNPTRKSWEMCSIMALVCINAKETTERNITKERRKKDSIDFPFNFCVLVHIKTTCLFVSWEHNFLSLSFHHTMTKNRLHRLQLGRRKSETESLWHATLNRLYVLHFSFSPTVLISFPFLNSCFLLPKWHITFGYKKLFQV